MGKLSILDPRVSIELHERPLTAGLDTLEGRVIGVLDNGQSNSTPMFEELAALLRDRYGAREVLLRKKPTHMQGAPEEMVAELTGRCDAIITGLGA